MLPPTRATQVLLQSVESAVQCVYSTTAARSDFLEVVDSCQLSSPFSTVVNRTPTLHNLAYLVLTSISTPISTPISNPYLFIPKPPRLQFPIAPYANRSLSRSVIQSFSPSMVPFFSAYTFLSTITTTKFKI